MSELNNHKAYAIATKIERDSINPFLKEYPISKHNAKEWLIITRTLESTLKIIEEECKKRLTKKTLKR